MSDDDINAYLESVKTAIISQREKGKEKVDESGK